MTEETKPEAVELPTVRMGHLHDLAKGRCQDPGCWANDVPEGAVTCRRQVRVQSGGRMYFGKVVPTREALFRRDEIVISRKDRFELWDLWLEQP